MSDLSNNNQIEMYLHCSLCLQEWEADPKIKTVMSPAEYARTQSGWTKQGLQVWCNRHECNVVHIDFEGQKHPANVTRKFHA